MVRKRTDPLLMAIQKAFGDLAGERIYNGKSPKAREALVKRLRVAGKI